MLISMKDRDIRRARQPLFNREAARGGNVFETDRAERGDQQRDTGDDLVGILGVQTDGKGVHSGKGFQQHRVPFHDGHGGVRASVAEIQHFGTICHEGDGVSPARVFKRLLRICVDGQARFRDAGRVDETQNGPVPDRNLAFDADDPPVPSSRL